MATEDTTATLLTGIAVVTALFFAAATLSTFTAADTGDTNDNATVNVTVATKTVIDITPNEYVWNGLDPGTQSHDSSKHRAQIENIGSTNISKIWFNVTQPASTPFATGDESNYDSGNFIALAKKGNSNYTFVDRQEFNETNELVYITGYNGNTPPDRTQTAYGRFRNASKEYFWNINYTAGTTCSEIEWRDGHTAHTKTQTGTVDFSDSGSDYDTVLSGSISASTNGNFCFADVDLGQNGPGYVAVIDNSTLGSADTSVKLTRWNADYEGITGQSNHHYFWNEQNNGFLTPGDSTVAELAARVAQGVADGDVSVGTLRVIAKGS